MLYKIIHILYKLCSVTYNYLTTNITIMKKNIILTFAFLVSISSFSQTTGTMKDIRDGHIYKTVKIGTQTWMAENLAYYSEEGCKVYNDKFSYAQKYGIMYDLETSKNVCPTGWHLPSIGEWVTLLNNNCLFTSEYKKEIGDSIWLDVDKKMRNNFLILPCGTMNCYGEFMSLNETSSFWSSSVGLVKYPLISYDIYENFHFFNNCSGYTEEGYESCYNYNYIRCVKN